MSTANPWARLQTIITGLRVWRRQFAAIGIWGRVLAYAGAFLVLADIVRLLVLSPQYQEAFTDAFDAAIVIPVAIVVSFAAARSSGLTRGLWAMTAIYFALIVPADATDFLVDLHVNRVLSLSPREFLGWFIYLALALVIFFPTPEEGQLKWKWLPVLDFALVAIAIGLADFRFIYLQHLAKGRTAMYGTPEFVRNSLIALGLLLRAGVEPSVRARAIYRAVGAAFATITILAGMSPAHESMVSLVGRPAAFLMLGVFAASWSDHSYPQKESAQRAAKLRMALSSCAATTLVVVLFLAYDAPPGYRGVIYSLAAISAGLFILRSFIAEYARHATAQALTERDERLRAMFNHQTVGMAITSTDKRWLEVNDAWCEMIGYSREELEARDWAALTHAEDLAADLEQYNRLIAGEIERYPRQKRFIRKDGSILYAEVSVDCVRRADGSPEYFVGLVTDITARKKAEEALRVSEDSYRNFVAQSSEGISRQDLDSPIPIDLPEDDLVRHILYDSYLAECNEAIVKMYGLNSVQDVLGKRLTEFLDPNDPVNIELTREYVRSGFRVLERESRETDIHGNTKVFLNSMMGIVEKGKLVRTWGIQRDVTERVRLEEERTKAEALVSLQKEILETIAKGVPLEEILTILVRRIESQWPGLRGSVLLLDEDRVHVRHGAAPSLPAAYVKAVDGEPIGPKAGSCGTGMYRKAPVIVTDVLQDPLWEDYRELAVAHGLRACWSTPILNSQGQVLGSFAMYYGEARGPSPAELRLIEVATDLASIAIDRWRAEEKLRHSEERFRVALKDSPITVFNQDLNLRYTWIFNPQFYRQQDILGKTDEEILGEKEAERLTELKRGVLKTGTAVREEVAITYAAKRYALDVTIEPLLDTSQKIIGITGSTIDIARLRELADSLQEAKDRLTEEKLYLQSEIQTELGFETIIGQSPSLKEVLKKARVVAPTDSNVLLLGETGTGKELVARSIHSLSDRREKNFITLNCAAVPTGLLESELFGHEKGAFTSADRQKLGRLELADKGTLFLDEIGELALALQPKLLRVLQEQEFERLGGTRTLRVDVRIISATNRDLRKDVAEKKFREDLFYRLNVFPIYLPPLRERKADIPMLVHHFVRKQAGRMGKHIETVPKETMKLLQNWNWPGNVRELENVIERMVILTKESMLAAPPRELEVSEVPSQNQLSEVSREHIIRVLRETNGVLAGPHGAACRLGIKRTTLQSMMKRLGIESQDYQRGTGTYGWK